MTHYPKLLILSLFFAVFVLSSCHPEKNIAYMQDIQGGEIFRNLNQEEIKLKAGDQIMIFTVSESPILSSIFNLQSQGRVDGRGYNENPVAFTIDTNGEVDFPRVWNANFKLLKQHNGCLTD